MENPSLSSGPLLHALIFFRLTVRVRARGAKNMASSTALQVGRSFRPLGCWTGSSVRMGRLFCWGGGGADTESLDVFLREPRPLGALAEFPGEEDQSGGEGAERE